MATPQETTKEFQRLAGEAQSGNFYIEADAANQLISECDTYIAGLRDLAVAAQRTVRVESFGTLTSAKALGQKFYDLANGGPGSGSYTAAILEHITVLEALKDMYQKAAAAYQACDDDTKAKIKQQQHKLNW
ncbi:hypothetical protein ACFVMC_00725 [Nocardia sp. NPDC127579]|uniref:hypothetical protein n=1 Tax=Nocardia sp. NPDC127579 TaxID=3345402 RepID=UPI003628CC03